MRWIGEGVPEEDAVERVVLQGQVEQAALADVEVRVVAPGHREHPRREVDAGDDDPAVGEVTRHPSRAAPGVEDTLSPGTADEPEEVVDHREVHRGLGLGRGVRRGVVFGDRVVR